MGEKIIINKLIFELLFFFFFSLVPLPGFCDLVYLKTGKTIEGVVEKESSSSVVLNIGSGQVILNKTEINHIYKYTPEEHSVLMEQWSYKYFMLPDYIPEGFKDVIDDFKNVEHARKIAIESKKKLDQNKKLVKGLEEESAQFKKRLNEINTKISKMKPEDNVKEYNSLIDGSNVLFSKVQVAEYEKERLQKTTPVLNKRISEYVNDLTLFRKAFMDRYVALNKKSKELNKFFFEGIKNKMEEMETDFTQYEIDYNRYDSGIFVEAVLNDLVKANFIVDTGASVVVISKEVADKLALSPEIDRSAFEVTLADGSKAKASPVILKSIKVGEARIENVPAAIIEKKGISEEDGLLGMSFLKNFLVRINTKENKLILEEFNP
jgi:clan AA aspartic protease (TIGR02281 family)